MSEENVSLLVLAVGTALIYDHQLPRKKKRRKRRYWVKTLHDNHEKKQL